MALFNPTNGTLEVHRVRFVPDRVNGQFTVTKIEKAK
jgi:hypothetical protein